MDKNEKYNKLLEQILEIRKKLPKEDYGLIEDLESIGGRKNDIEIWNDCNLTVAIIQGQHMDEKRIYGDLILKLLKFSVCLYEKRTK